MKKLIFILLMFAGGLAAQEVGDATITAYANTYINTNNVGSITGAQMNQVLNYLIDSKVNKDSATTVRIAATKDSLFITYYGYAEDTVLVGDSPWTESGDSVYVTGKNVGIGTESPATALHIQDSTGSLGMIAYMFSTTTGAYPQLNFGKHNGTPSSFAALATNTNIGGIGFNGSYNTSTLASGAAIRVRTTQAWSASARGNEMLFWTTENDSAAAAINVRIDSNANVLVPNGDVVTWGGYADWTPTIAWVGGTPGAATINKARYSVINRTVTFMIDIEGSNDSGSQLTGVSFTPPVSIPDTDTYIPCDAAYVSAAKTTPTERALALIDAETNLKIYVTGMSIPNTEDYRVTVCGVYEILNK